MPATCVDRAPLQAAIATPSNDRPENTSHCQIPFGIRTRVSCPEKRFETVRFVSGHTGGRDPFTKSRSDVAVACTISQCSKRKKGRAPPSLEPRCRPHLRPASTLRAFRESRRFKVP